MFDAWVMIKRCLLISLRNPETLIMAVVTPFFLMVLFGTIFGGVADIGDYVNYIDFIVPGIILQSVAQGTQYAAINVHNDMAKGVIDRFRSMPIRAAAVLVGHVAASVIRNTLTSAVIIGTAFIVGFRPQGGVGDWLVAVGVLMLFNIAISWIAVVCGLLAKSVESSAGYMFPFFILPFVSSGFAPTETLPRWLRGFATHQPLTPVIDAVRNAMMGFNTDNSLWLALLWLAGLIVVSFFVAMVIFNRKQV